ncbi:hypothetical protein [Natrinema pallidum]|uniref:Uncharacterized protein n=1 Tax=Natrinema pallidum TaxID=69527 RepID=A0A4P9TJZ6_9EURY|nr:hypothetical protein [Natrinema pallidum]QCW05299.1 hypothetical protein FGF80_18840 [Natrinema pallidum]
MATTQPPTTDATLPTDWTLQWPAFDRDHDPEYLATNDSTSTTQRTLADYGGNAPTDPERPSFPTDTRERTEQQSVFRYPREWWRDADRLEALFHDRDLAIGEIAELLGDDACYEVVRTALEDYGVRDPGDDSLAAQLEAADPGDVGDPLPEAFGSTRGERA